ncbi:AAA family ATPase [Clostridium sp. 19966]|uniref:ATP-dependent nuclease n=1 Tax=Clostridium sp. 19966 TaxID=2768166 RepID=UPI0028DFE222|nr:AAA family ATPase [Clostridium sp. 19966]MDT8718885.1 AAA family ATPase [Clostridium sp. 19966]
MYISKLIIEGYKNCKNESEIQLHKGLNILVGENASGKTTIINALRMILKENEFSQMNINEDDFYKSFNEDEYSQDIKINISFEELSSDEEVTFLTWCDADFKAKLCLEVDSNSNRKGYFRKNIWGGDSKSSAFEEETFDSIDCIYLPPLRDAEEKLSNGKKSRLAKLLRHQYKTKDDEKVLVEKVSEFNNSITSNQGNNYKEISKAKEDINYNIKSSMGEIFGQSINLQFADVSFNKILENIKMVFFPEINATDIKKFRDIAINSLGYNNLLYIATVFAELQISGKVKDIFTVLLIEEPEAHLHPQLQIKLIKYLESLANKKTNTQIIITTHSPILASSVSIDNLIHICERNESIKATPLCKLELGDSKNYINRWLDVTKSTLLFSKGIILVEGISESMLVPELAKICLCKYNKVNTNNKLPSSLEEAGVSVININGINFKHFIKLFCSIDGSYSNIKVPIRCSGITDNDPEKEELDAVDKNGDIIKVKIDTYPKLNETIKGKNSALELISKINISKYVRLYHSPLKTFEYDLAMEGNTQIMAKALKDVWYSKNGEVKNKCDEIIADTDNIKLQEYSKFIHQKASDKKLGKGMFAQELAGKVKTQYDQMTSQVYLDSKAKKETYEEIIKIFNVPKYIYNSVIWACGGDVGE